MTEDIHPQLKHFQSVVATLNRMADDEFVADVTPDTKYVDAQFWGDNDYQVELKHTWGTNNKGKTYRECIRYKRSDGEYVYSREVKYPGAISPKCISGKTLDEADYAGGDE